MPADYTATLTPQSAPVTNSPEPILQFTVNQNSYASIYIFNHQRVAPGRLQIRSRNGVEFEVVASGKNEEGIEFSVEATAVFRGIRVRGSEKDTEETILARLKSQLEVSNLNAGPFKLRHRYESGVGMGEAIFTPKP